MKFNVNSIETEVKRLVSIKKLGRDKVPLSVIRFFINNYLRNISMSLMKNM